MKNELVADERIRELAIVGAIAEVERLFRLFPEVKLRILAEAAAATTPADGRRQLTPKQRLAISRRMKRYWRKRRRGEP